MGDETVVTNVEIVKTKLKKYMALQEHGKVNPSLFFPTSLSSKCSFQIKEYLRKLHHLHLNSILIQVMIRDAISIDHFFIVGNEN